MLTAAGAAFQLLGMGLLGTSGARSGARAGIPILGLLAIATGIGLFVQDSGLELGIAWALALLSLAAYLRILWPLPLAPKVGHRRGRRTSSGTAPVTSRWRLAGRLFSAGPLYLLAALGCGLLVSTQTDWLEQNRLLTGAFLIPFLWSLGALHATADTRLLRIFLIPVAIILSSAAGVLL
ncbi:MAG: hypothetical protein AAGD40_05685 [Pseudomonadota bacterium]